MNTLLRSQLRASVEATGREALDDAFAALRDVAASFSIIEHGAEILVRVNGLTACRVPARSPEANALLDLGASRREAMRKTRLAFEDVRETLAPLSAGAIAAYAATEA